MEQVEIFEVGPRDGLQNEPGTIATSDKIALVDCLSQAGFRRIECASFVSPKWVPQMADSAEVLAGISRAEGVRYAALTPNAKGLERAMAAGADEVAIFGSASEGFSRANINASIAESLARFAPVAKAAQAAGVPVRGYVSCVVECPYDGAVPPAAVLRVAQALADMGCYEISLGDTLGRATPQAMDAMLRAVVPQIGAGALAGHFHDTGGQALHNIDVALDHGLRVFDAAVGGLGGCPYAPGAAGNVASEAVARHLANKGYDTGLDMGLLDQAAALARGIRTRAMSPLDAVAKAFAMDERTWRRHANPWSGWSRAITGLPLLALAIWSRVWIGWWCLPAFGAVALWLWLNPRLFAAPQDMSSWMSRGVMGEKVLIEQGARIPAHHRRMARLLGALAAPGTLIFAMGLWQLRLDWVLLGGALAVLAKFWFLDRMVWLAADWETAGGQVWRKEE